MFFPFLLLTVLLPIVLLLQDGLFLSDVILTNENVCFYLQKCDTSSAALIFICDETSTTLLPKWLAALEPSSITVLGQRRMPRQCSLPSVEEED